MAATCPVKDDNYYKILKAVNYNENFVIALYEAYQEKGLKVPSYEELVKNHIIKPELFSRITPLENMYRFASDRISKSMIAIQDKIRDIDKSIKALVKNNPNNPEIKNLQKEKGNLRNELSRLRVVRTKINNSLRSIKERYNAFKENSGAIYYDDEGNPVIKQNIADVDIFLSNIVTHVRDILPIIEDMLNQKNLSSSSIIVARRVADTLISLGTQENNPLIREGEEEKLQKIGLSSFAYLNELHRMGDTLRTKINTISNQLVLNELRQSFGDNVPENLTEFFNDISELASNVLAIGEYDNPITAHISMLTKKASYESTKEIGEMFKIIDELNDKLKGFDSETLKTLFIQEEYDYVLKRTYKVPKLRTRYTPEWYKRFSRFRKSLAGALMNGDTKLAKSIIGEVKTRALFINPLDLFDKNGNLLNSKQAKLILQALDAQELTPVHRETVMKELKDKAIKYHKAKEEHFMYLETMYEDKETINRLKKNWEEVNNPGEVIGALHDIYEDGRINKIYKENHININFLYALPKKYYIHKKKNKDTGNYDPKFSVIENNPALHDAYLVMEELLTNLRGFLPRHLQAETTFNSIPFITRTLVDSLLDRGLSGILPTFWEKLLNDITVSNENEMVPFISVNPDGTTIPSVKVKGLKFYENFLDRYVDKKMEAYFMDRGITKPSDMTTREFIGSLKSEEIKKYYREAKVEASEELVNKMDFNLGTLLKVYSAAVITYKNMTKVEDSILAMRDFLANASAMERTSSGKVVKDSSGRPIVKEAGLEHMLKAVDYHIRIMFGYEKADPEMVTSKKIYSKEEKKILEELEKQKEKIEQDYKEGKIKESEYIEKITTIKTKEKGLGRKISTANVIDLLNNYIRIKGLGWNPIAPIANINVAYFANMAEASRHKYLTPKDLVKGYQYFFSHRKKVVNIFKKLSNIQSVQSELYNKVLRSRVRKLHPMYLTESAEFFNQAPLVVGYMLATKVKVNGKEISLFDVFNEEGELAYDESQISFVRKQDQSVKFSSHIVKARIDWLISRVHGNYDPETPIRANSKVLFRSLLVFRKWIINSFYNRIQKEQTQYIMNDIEKGRWRSYGAFYKEYGILGGTLNLSFGLIKKMLFVESKFDRLNELDAANMRANMMEIVFVGYIAIIGLMLKNLLDSPDDDEDDISNYWLIFTMNILGRLTRDILLYTDPDQFKSMLRDPIPVWGLLIDFKDAILAAVDLITGQPDELSAREWDKRVDKDVKKLRRLLPYGFNTLDKLETYSTNKNLYR